MDMLIIEIVCAPGEDAQTVMDNIRTHSAVLSVTDIGS
jgi:hypothetical protein